MKSSEDTNVPRQDDLPGPAGPYPGAGSSDYETNARVDPLRDYGRADVDPFYIGPGGLGSSPPGGMVFDPFRRVRPRSFDPSSGLIQPLPRGSVPPGARFDPFGPPGLRPSTGGNSEPNPDIERMPHFNDDFYS